MEKLLFLGGTAGHNKWRDTLTDTLISRGVSAGVIFNPVVADWNEEAQAREEAAKASASHLLFYIANPMQEGNPLSTYSMVEATMALYDKPDRTVVVFDSAGIEGHFLKALNQAKNVLKTRFPAARIYDSVDTATDMLAKDLTP